MCVVRKCSNVSTKCVAGRTLEWNKWPLALRMYWWCKNSLKTCCILHHQLSAYKNFQTLQIERIMKGCCSRLKELTQIIQSTPADPETHVKQFLFQQLDIPKSEIYDSIRVPKMPQSKKMLITLSHHIFKIFLYQATKSSINKSSKAYCEIFINKKMRPICSYLEQRCFLMATR